MTLRLGGFLLLAVLLPAQTLDNCRQMYRRGQLAETARCYQSLASSRDPYLRAEAQWALERYKQAWMGKTDFAPGSARMK